VDIFKLVGSVFVDTEEANKSLAKTDEKAGGVGKTLLKGVSSAGKFAVGLGSAAVAGAAALMGVATKASETADEIDKMSQKMGISKKGYQEWSYVMGQNGMDINTLQTGMKTLVNQMESAANGSKTASANFEQLGISIYDSNGKLKDQETIMNEAIYALADMEDATMRSMMATNLFGKAGAEMMPMLNSGKEGMQELTQRAHDLGLVMSDDAVNAGVVFGDTLDDVKKSFGMVVSQIGIQVMPIIQKLLDWVLDNMPMIQEVFGEVFSFVGEVVVVAMDIIESLAPVIEAVFNMIIQLWDTSLKPILMNIIDFIGNIFAGDFSGAFENIVNVVKSIWDGLLVIIRNPINDVIKLINLFIGGLNKIKVPDWVPGLGGKGLNIPEIPLLAKGGNVISAGRAIVGEAGPELIDLPVGAKVTPLSQGNGFAGSDKIEQKLDALITLIGQMANAKVGVYINGEVLVGQLLPGIDTGLGKLAARSGRGV
jgi:hypothetical protein